MRLLGFSSLDCAGCTGMKALPIYAQHLCRVHRLLRAL
jgi:hypothetical protein